MIICCHTSIQEPWSSMKIKQKLGLLSTEIAGNILRKKQEKDIQLAIGGKLLLMQVLKELQMPLSLDDLKYTEYHRPYFNAAFDFNISHSGNVVVCCGTMEGRVGIDVELEHQVNLSDFTNCFKTNEWNKILNTGHQNKAFFNFWTRKEAVLKAAGTGFNTPLLDIDVSTDEVPYNDHIYYLTKVDLYADYPCHIATTGKQNIKVIPVII
jgi:4'-phosphopantetheinyl transferase